MKRLLLAAVLMLTGVACGPDPAPAATRTRPPALPERQRIQVRSTLDGSLQDSYLILPSSRGLAAAPRPLAVLLHTWSSDFEQRHPEVEAEADARGWLLLTPNFRGRNDHPAACGSQLAQQDVLDAVAWVRSRHEVDDRRIYVLGLSGGGFMTMLMAGRYPEAWAAASAWVGISDLQAWYEQHRGDEYGAMMRGCFGGSPAETKELASLYRERSPLTYLRPGLGVPLDLAAGKDDPVVPVEQTLRAFEALAPGALSEAERARLQAASDVLQPGGPTAEQDPLIERRILVRRTVGDVRLTVFDGGHEWFPRAAMEWLAQHRRQ